MPSTESSPDSRDNLELEALALLEFNERSKRAPLYYYRPTPKGALFHNNRANKRIFSGGNRSSKTETGVVEACAYALGWRPWVARELGYPEPKNLLERPDNLPPEALTFNTAGIRTQVPIDILCVSGLPAKKGIGEALFPKLKKYLGRHFKHVRMGHAGVPIEVVVDNGSRFLFGTAEQDAMAFEGTNYGAVHFDEPFPRAIWPGVMRGTIDQCAPTWCTFTPCGNNAAWMFYELVSATDGKNIWTIEASIYDNPYLSPEAIKEFERDPVLSESEREARLYGKFSILTDRIYSIFREDIHIIDPWRPHGSWVPGMVIDPHSVRPWAMGYFACSPNGDVIVWREWPTEPFHKLRRDTRSIEEYAQLIRKLDSNFDIGCRLIDPNAGPARSTQKGIYIPSFTDELARYGLFFHHRFSDDIEYGEGLVKRLLAFNPKEALGPTNRPRLYITSDCQNFITSLKYYSAKSKAGTLGEPDEGKRDETFKDFADLLRYIASSGLADQALRDSWDPLNNVYDDEPRDATYND